MENLGELLASIVSVLVVIVPLYLYMLSRRAISRRKERKEQKSAPEKQEQSEKKKPHDPLKGRQSLLQQILRAQGIKGRPADYAEPVTVEPAPPPAAPRRKERAFSRQEAPVPAAKALSPLEKLSGYPVNKRAVIMSEIIGKPKGLP